MKLYKLLYSVVFMDLCSEVIMHEWVEKNNADDRYNFFTAYDV